MCDCYVNQYKLGWMLQLNTTYYMSPVQNTETRAAKRNVENDAMRAAKQSGQHNPKVVCPSQAP